MPCKVGLCHTGVVLFGIVLLSNNTWLCRMNYTKVKWTISVVVLIPKPSAHSPIFVAEDEDFCRWRRKLAVCGKQTSTIFVADDDLQYQTC